MFGNDMKTVKQRMRQETIKECKESKEMEIAKGKIEHYLPKEDNENRLNVKNEEEFEKYLKNNLEKIESALSILNEYNSSNIDEIDSTEFIKLQDGVSYAEIVWATIDGIRALNDGEPPRLVKNQIEDILGGKDSAKGVAEDIHKYSSNPAAKKLMELYEPVLNE